MRDRCERRANQRIADQRNRRVEWKQRTEGESEQQGEQEIEKTLYGEQRREAVKGRQVLYE